MIVQKLGGTDWKYRDIQEKEWHDANVPGTLFMDMIREGRILFIVSRRENFRSLHKRIMNMSCVLPYRRMCFSEKNSFWYLKGLIRSQTSV